ncbi:MAG: hypothetical protein HYS27_23745 [Deltaproteobacteria bacterium]|nr:hypothetical protein [Deltaproteobacteria bacterium]
MPTATDLLTAARLPTSRSGAKISSGELREAFAAAKAPSAGDPAGKPITAEEAALFRGLAANEMTSYAARHVLPGLLAEIPGLLQTGGTSTVTTLPAKRGNEVFLGGNGFCVDAAGTAPANALETTRTLHKAGKWLQASFGTDDNLFAAARLDVAGKRAVLQQLDAAITGDLSSLSAKQKEQLLGSSGALIAELIKSIEFVPQVPAQNAPLLALRDQAMATLLKVLDHADSSVLVKRGLVGYLTGSDTLNARLTTAQKAELTTRKDALAVKAPADYAAWQAAGKDRIVVDHVAGAGENFVFGFVKQLQQDGIDGRSVNSPRFTVKSGDTTNGPCVLEAKVPAGHPLNTWGREMTIEVRVREMSRDMYRGMGDAGIDIVHYGGHSNFGQNTLQSLRNAPTQNGHKVVLRDLCAGADTKNAEAHVYPEASLNSVTSVGSSYFRTTDDPTVGKYAYASEGYDMLMSVTRGLLGKKDWKVIGEDLEKRANWYGHDSKNNWTHPGDPRAGSMVDDDDDGVPNIFDLMPAYDTTDVDGSTASEFELTAPTQRADEISGRRAFQAIQFANTAVAYNSALKPLNSERLLHADPNGIFFDAKDHPNEYVRFRRGQNGERLVQLSSALADMTIESLRAVMFYELAIQLGRENPRLYADRAERTGMALVFAQAALEFDDSWRDQQIFDGLKKLYNLPAGVSLSTVSTARAHADEQRHNYTGDLQAARDVATAYRTELSAPGAGDPALAIA